MSERRGFKRPVIACYECGFTQPENPDESCDSTRCVNCGGGLEEVPESLVRIIEELEAVIVHGEPGTCLSCGSPIDAPASYFCQDPWEHSVRAGSGANLDDPSRPIGAGYLPDQEANP